MYEKKCKACLSDYTVFVQNVIGNRTKNLYEQYVCLDCLSFFHESNYKEDSEQLQKDFAYLLSYRESHQSLMNRLFLELITRAPHITRVCEIGHGSGMFMKAANDYGKTIVGYELNPILHEFVKNELKLDSRLEQFSVRKSDGFDLIASIMVFEHLISPRELFSTMVSALNADGVIYISVPFLSRSQWAYLKSASSTPNLTPPDPFYDNDVHINHFSVDGLRKLGVSLGAREADYFISKDTFHKSPGSYHGILFKF